MVFLAVKQTELVAREWLSGPRRLKASNFVAVQCFLSDFLHEILTIVRFLSGCMCSKLLGGGNGIFAPPNLGFSVFETCGLRFLFYFGLGFSAKIKSGLRIFHLMRFGFFPVCLWKICVSTTSTAYKSSLIQFWSKSISVFYYYLYGFSVSYKL